MRGERRGFLFHRWFGTNWNPASHTTILLITLALLAIQTLLNITGAKVMGRVAQFGVAVEVVGTFGIALILAIHGFHHSFGFLFSTQGATHAATNAYAIGRPMRIMSTYTTSNGVRFWISTERLAGAR